MAISSLSNHYLIKYPRYLFLFILFYAMFVVMSNWYVSKFIEFFGIFITPSALIYSITFLQSTMISEVYGFKNARLAIYYALIFNVLFILYGFITQSLPVPSNIMMATVSDNFFVCSSRIVLASFVCYFISQSISAYLVSNLKIQFRGKHLGLRLLIATVFSGLLDTAIFLLTAFSGTINQTELPSMVVHAWFIKISIEILFLPLCIYITKRLKNIEKLDIYDTETKFTVLSLDTNYTKRDNRYEKV